MTQMMWTRSTVPAVDDITVCIKVLTCCYVIICVTNFLYEIASLWVKIEYLYLPKKRLKSRVSFIPIFHGNCYNAASFENWGIGTVAKSKNIAAVERVAGTYLSHKTNVCCDRRLPEIYFISLILEYHCGNSPAFWNGIFLHLCRVTKQYF